jgi:hypothetical protein
VRAHSSPTRTASSRSVSSNLRSSVSLDTEGGSGPGGHGVRQVCRTGQGEGAAQVWAWATTVCMPLLAAL